MLFPFLDLKAEYATMKPDIRAAVDKVLESQLFIMGPEVKQLEAEIAALVGCRFALACASGSDAILLSLMALGVDSGDEVITPPFTFVATAGSIARLNAKPVFVDIDRDTYNLDPNLLEAAITTRTKAIMPVHLFGRPAPLGELAALGLPVVEDAAQAFGAPGIATTGVVSTFSFYPTKNLGGLGDGGLVAVTDEALGERIRLLRFHGSRDKVDFELIGYNSRLDELQAAALRLFLPHVDEWNRERREAVARYAELGLGDVVELPEEDPGHVYHLFVVRSADRDRNTGWRWSGVV
jgi:dTDP-4-amino-4,6-dideoxygalactose transaminase